MKKRVLLCIVVLLCMVGCSSNGTPPQDGTTTTKEFTSTQTSTSLTTTVTTTAATQPYNGVALQFPRQIVYEGCFHSYTAEAVDDHTLLYTTENYGEDPEQAYYALTADEVERLNTLYASITDYSEDEMGSASTNDIMIYQGDDVYQFAEGCALQGELNHYTYILQTLYWNASQNANRTIIWDCPSDEELSMFDNVRVTWFIGDDPNDERTITRYGPRSIRIVGDNEDRIEELSVSETYQLNCLYEEMLYELPTWENTGHDALMSIDYNGQTYILSSEQAGDSIYGTYSTMLDIFANM